MELIFCVIIASLFASMTAIVIGYKKIIIEKLLTSKIDKEEIDDISKELASRGLTSDPVKHEWVKEAITSGRTISAAITAFEKEGEVF